ncbi:MAG: M28 family peptidase [Planctomycetota bacterium]|nr:M28 family peptidase [Planctomycetota bacterium]
MELAKIPFDGKECYRVLKQVCELGPRITGSEAMLAQQELLIRHFESFGAKIVKQEFKVRHPLTGSDIKVVNLIVQWHPGQKKRLLLCCHYDTRPYPDKDLFNPRGKFLGANDGASGVALFYELGKHMSKLKCSYGIDFVFFDAEEFVYDRRRDPLFVGSEYFATDYIKNPPAHRYVSGVLVDMIGDAKLQIFYEKNSMQYAPILTRGIWNTAKKLGVKEFIPRQRHKVRDDHLPLNQIAKIPTTDLIDFDYPTVNARRSYWHTQDDTVDKCSALSFAKVGWVIHQWLQEVK